jgi:hypothetical protein
MILGKEFTPILNGIYVETEKDKNISCKCKRYCLFQAYENNFSHEKFILDDYGFSRIKKIEIIPQERVDFDKIYQNKQHSSVKTIVKYISNFININPNTYEGQWKNLKNNQNNQAIIHLSHQEKSILHIPVLDEVVRFILDDKNFSHCNLIPLPETMKLKK